MKGKSHMGYLGVDVRLTLIQNTLLFRWNSVTVLSWIQFPLSTLYQLGNAINHDLDASTFKSKIRDSDWSINTFASIYYSYPLVPFVTSNNSWLKDDRITHLSLYMRVLHVWNMWIGLNWLIIQRQTVWERYGTLEFHEVLEIFWSAERRLWWCS